MKRRQVLRMLAGVGASAALASIASSGLAGARFLAHRAGTLPADILMRIRRRTLPLDPRQLETNDDLAG